MIARKLLSLFILFHCAAVFFYPFSENQFVGKFSPLFQLYLMPLGMANPWGFFAPEPCSPTRLEFEVLDLKDSLLIKGAWPPIKNGEWFADHSQSYGPFC